MFFLFLEYGPTTAAPTGCDLQFAITAWAVKVRAGLSAPRVFNVQPPPLCNPVARRRRATGAGQLVPGRRVVAAVVRQHQKRQHLRSPAVLGTAWQGQPQRCAFQVGGFKKIKSSTQESSLKPTAWQDLIKQFF